MIEVLQMVLAGKCPGKAIVCTTTAISMNFDSYRKKGDYKKRGGLTSRPLTVKNFNEAPRILHLRLRSATWIEGLLIRLKAKHHQWGAGKPITDAQRKRLDKAEERMQVSAQPRFYRANRSPTLFICLHSTHSLAVICHATLASLACIIDALTHSLCLFSHGTIETLQYVFTL